MTKEEKLREILKYYEDTYVLAEFDTVETILEELLANNVEVRGNSFYCEVRDAEGRLCLLAGTKNKADIWVLKKIIKLIKTGQVFYTALNGNGVEIMKNIKKYNPRVLKVFNGIVYLSFNEGSCNGSN